MYTDYRFNMGRIMRKRKENAHLSKSKRLKAYIFRTVQNERYVSDEVLVNRVINSHELTKNSFNDRWLVRKYVKMFRKEFPQYNYSINTSPATAYKKLKRVIRERFIYETIYG